MFDKIHTHTDLVLFYQTKSFKSTKYKISVTILVHQNLPCIQI